MPELSTILEENFLKDDEGHWYIPDLTKSGDVARPVSYTHLDVYKRQVCKQKTFSVIWPGRMDGEKLFYAEEGFPDYKSYKISDYDITCIV